MIHYIFKYHPVPDEIFNDLALGVTVTNTKNLSFKLFM